MSSSRARRLIRDRRVGAVPASALDASQRRAVQARGSLVRVLGGAGTGKTTVAVHTVMDRVSGGLRPEQALVLAPTRVAAARLRRDLTTGLRTTTSAPLVSSVQAFAFGVLRRRSLEEGGPEPRLLSGPEQDVILRELLAGHAAGLGRGPAWPAELAEATRTRGFRAELRDLLMRAVEYGLDADGLRALAVRADRPAWAAAADVLEEYDEVTALSTPGGYDPAWLLTVVADMLEDEPDALAEIHDRLRVVVVDDAQELTAPAARLLRLLRSPESQLVLVGDPDAATQTFRGADPRLMLADPADVTCVLERSWRLPTSVAAVASRVTDRIGAVGSIAHRLDEAGRARWAVGAVEGEPVAWSAAQVPLPGLSLDTDPAGQGMLFDLEALTGAVGEPTGSPDGAPTTDTADAPDRAMAGGVWSATERRDAHEEPTAGAVETAVTATSTAEARFIAARLRRAHLIDGVPWSRMAVIVRGAARSATMRRVLSGDGIPVDVPGAHVPLREEPAVVPFLTLFEAALNIAAGQDSGIGPEVVLDLLGSPLGGTDSLAVRRLLRALRVAERRRLDQETGGDEPPLGDGTSVVTAEDGGDATQRGADEATVSPIGVPVPVSLSPRARSTDELLAAGLLGDPIVDQAADAGPVAGLRRLRDVLAAGVGAARRTEDGWRPGVTAETVLWAMWQASGLAEPWRRAALAGSRRADRDLDALVALTAAASRYVDRLPHRGPDGFLEHVRGQDVAGDTLVARAPSDDCITLTTPAGAAGLEWDLVVVAGLQEGVWPDLRLRGSVLGSADLVDVLTGRGTSTASARAEVRSDEARLFHVAIGRARHTLLCTAVRNEDETPSAFLDLVDRSDGERPFAQIPTPMTLGEAVAALRRRLTAAALLDTDPRIGPDESHGRLTDAVGALRGDDAVVAALLARLADAGVPGAAPEDWWGVRGVSDDRPRREPGHTITVSPSKVEAFNRCELRWLLTASGGQAGGGTVASSLGTLVHDIAAEIDNGDFPAMVAELDRRFGELDLPDGWIARRQHEKAVAMLDRLARQHTAALAAGWEVAGTEIDVRVQLGRAIVTGRVDRLERDAQNRLRVVDLKTGSSKPAKDDLPTHPQLGAYQVAVTEGAFGHLGNESAGAALMQIGAGGGVKGALQEQVPLSDSEDPRWAHTLLERTAEGMAGTEFRAHAGSWCRVCESRFSCPIQPEGETLR